MFMCGCLRHSLPQLTLRQIGLTLSGSISRGAMAVPLSQMWTVASYVIKQKLLGRKRYPLVLMLEPLYRCNLACAGCGKIQYPAHILKQEMDVDVAMAAVDECGAPMVSIPGGEPLMHSRIGEDRKS